MESERMDAGMTPNGLGRDAAGALRAVVHIQAALDELRAVQRGDGHSWSNTCAILKLREALHWLADRQGAEL